jgi:hypothetical protein
MSDESGAFRIGQVLATSYGVFARYFLLFFVLAFIANAPGLVLDLVSPAQAPPWLAAPAPGATAPAGAAGAVSPWLALPLIVLGLVLSFALSAAATYIVIADLRGTRFSLGEALGGGVRALPALIGMMLLLFLLFLGFALVIGLAWAVLALAIVGDAKTPYAAVLIPVFAVPVVIVGLKLSLAVPVIVAERAGAIQSMKRSSELTDRRLWQLFGLFAVAALILFVINAALFAAVAGVLGMPAFFSPVATLARHAIIAAEIPFYWAIVAVSYYYLRLASERSAVTVA